MQVSEDMIYPTDSSGEVFPIEKSRILWVSASRAEGGAWGLVADIDGWCALSWVWRPEDDVRDFREYVECLAPRKEYIYASANKDYISLSRGRDLVSVNVSGGYVEYSDGHRVNGSQLWLRWMRNVRKKWKKRRGRCGDLKEG